MIVGYAPDERRKAALHLGAVLARSADEDLVVASVVPAPWIPGMAKVDAEYREYLDQTAAEALDRARQNLPGDVSAAFVQHSARSAAVGLLELAEEHGANVVVLGSSSHGSYGHIALGSVTDRLVHSSPVTLAFAPRGFRSRPRLKVARATAAYGGSESGDELVLAAAKVAASVGAALRIASFAVWARPAYTTRLGTDPEDDVLQEWTSTMKRAAHEAVEAVEGLSEPPPVEAVIGHGASWADALDDIVWDEGDVLVVGSSDLGPVAQVFLGSRATKILRHSPVPVFVVPRGRAETLAHA
ncbi:MAG: universal stress protein [Nocardioidaceae bacterium]|jgi:nucleotide-binding universal stress UspA family protein|nr:universal stress protein [Nocardioidaceae bacterium]